MKNKSLPFFEAALILLGEIIVSLVICGVCLIFDWFSYKIVTGVVLGSTVTTLNFLFLALSTSRAFDKAVAARGTREMDEEEIEKFTEEHQNNMNNAVKISFIVRTLTMLATLIVAFILDVFNVLATLIPLLALRPIIMIEALIREKFKKGNS